MLAYALEKGETCQMCGTAKWQWDEDSQAFEPVLDICPGCAQRDMFRESIGDQSRSPGASVILIPHAVSKALRALPRRRPRSPREKAGKKVVKKT